MFCFIYSTIKSKFAKTSGGDGTKVENIQCIIASFEPLELTDHFVEQLFWRYGLPKHTDGCEKKSTRRPWKTIFCSSFRKKIWKEVKLWRNKGALGLNIFQLQPLHPLSTLWFYGPYSAQNWKFSMTRDSFDPGSFENLNMQDKSHKHIFDKIRKWRPFKKNHEISAGRLTKKYLKKLKGTSINSIFRRPINHII